MKEATFLSEDEEAQIDELFAQARSEMLPSAAEHYTTTIDCLRSNKELIGLPAAVVLRQIALAFGLGRRYEAIVQSDMRAEEE